MGTQIIKNGFETYESRSKEGQAWRWRLRKNKKIIARSLDTLATQKQMEKEIGKVKTMLLKAYSPPEDPVTTPPVSTTPVVIPPAPVSPDPDPDPGSAPTEVWKDPGSATPVVFVNPLPRENDQLIEVPYETLLSSWKDNGLAGMHPFFLDHVYTVPTKEYISKIIEYSSINKQEYINDKKDCDDFAKAFYAETSFLYGITAVALVIDFSSNHAYNVFWMKEGNLLKIQVIEPQTDEIQVIGEAGYEAKSGIALI